MLVLTVFLALAPPSVVGSWTLMGMPFAKFDKNGSCVIEEEACTWRVTGSTLFITGDGETEAVPFTLSGGTLTLTVNGIPIALEKPGKTPAPATGVTPPPANDVAPQGNAAGGAAKNDLNDPLAKLLLSSAWCNFWFNKTTGYSGSSRVQYFADGTYQLGKKSEGYSSGYGGTFASEGQSGSSGRWYVQKGMFYGTPPPSDQDPNPQTFYPFPMQVSRNSNGSPIITAGGKEYSQCQ
jgi:hypothetical protein